MMFGLTTRVTQKLSMLDLELQEITEISMLNLNKNIRRVFFSLFNFSLSIAVWNFKDKAFFFEDSA